MHRFFPVAALAALCLSALCLTEGCGDEWFDYYPHHEIPTTQADMVKSGPDYYGGRNNNSPLLITGSGAGTNPSTSSTTTSSGMP